MKKEKELKAIKYICEWVKGQEGIMARIGEEEITIPTKNRLEFLQKQVGGYIEIVNHKGKDYVVEDEGLLKDKPLNLYMLRKGMQLVGTVLEIQGKLD